MRVLITLNCSVDAFYQYLKGSAYVWKIMNIDGEYFTLQCNDLQFFNSIRDLIKIIYDE